MFQPQPDVIDVTDRSARLLIVDDDPDIREPTAAFLYGHGYPVDTAPDGAAMAGNDYALPALVVTRSGAIIGHPVSLEQRMRVSTTPRCRPLSG